MKSDHAFPVVPRLLVLSKLAKFVKNPIPSLTAFHEHYGDSFYMHVGGLQKSLITRDPKILKEIFQRQHRNVEKSELQTKTVAQYVGKGLLTNTGPDWLRQRRLIQPGFHRDKIENLMGLMMGVIEDFCQKIEQEEKQLSFSLSKEMQDLSFEIITRTLISRPIPDADLKAMSRVVSEVQEFMVKQVRLPFLQPFFKITGLVSKHKNMVQEMRQQLLGYVNERKNNPGETDDLLDMLLATRYEDNGEPMSEERLIDEMLILFVAGHETSANALDWTFYLLCRHPEWVAAIRGEASAFFSQPLSLQSLKLLNITERVIQEAMRLYPPAWITDRITLQEVTLGDKQLPKDTLIIPFIYGMHHHPEYWPEPEKFDPNRFLPEAIKNRPAYTYLPFGGGPRFCIGNSFSMMEMQLIVASLCHRFDFEMTTDKNIDVKPLVTLRMAQEARIKWRPRTVETKV